MSFYLNGVGVEAELLAGMPLYRGHEVADQPYRALVMEVCVLPPLVGGAACVLDSFGGAFEFILFGREDLGPSIG